MWNYENDEELDEFFDLQDEACDDVEIITGDDLEEQDYLDDDVEVMNYEETESIAGGATGKHRHAWTLVKVISEPTATHDGKIQIRCKGCGAVKETAVRKGFKNAGRTMDAKTRNALAKGARAIKNRRNNGGINR